MEKVAKILSNYDHKESNIIQILDEIQKEFNYLPRETLEYVSEEIDIPIGKIYSIATFYSAFSLIPRGKHFITVCMGTACHVRSAPLVLSQIEQRLGIKAGMTTGDGMFTLETVNCLGACALAPIVVVDGNYHGQTTPKKVDSILNKYKKKSKKSKKQKNET